MSDKTIGLEQIPVIKELVEGAIAEVIAPIKADIADITPQILPPNAKVVYCDGDYDEVKLQAAIDELAEAGGGVVYPVGECVITAENTVAAAENKAVQVTKTFFAIQPGVAVRCQFASIRLYDNVIIDGSYCKSIELSVTSISKPQNITFFAIPNGGTLRNLSLHMTCETDAIKKMCPYTLLGENATIENCRFINIYGSNTPVGGNVAYASLVLVNSKVENFIIDSPFTRGGNTNARFIIMNDCYIRNMEYINSTALETSNTSKGIIMIRGDIDTLKFSDSELYRLSITGNVSGRNIAINNVSMKDNIALYNVDGAELKDIVSSWRLILQNVSNVIADNVTMRLEIYLFAKIENVWITNLSVTSSPKGCAFYTDDSIITNSKFFMHPEQSDIENMSLIQLEDGSNSTVIIKNNITNLVTLTNGGLKTRSIISDNLTASAMITGTVTLTSNSESGFIEGARITATAADGDVQGANISSIGQATYLWQKSADGTTWDNIANTATTYTLKGDEGYIRCGVYDEYGFYAGAVYSDAYAVTGTTEEE